MLVIPLFDKTGVLMSGDMVILSHPASATNNPYPTGPRNSIHASTDFASLFWLSQTEQADYSLLLDDLRRSRTSPFLEISRTKSFTRSQDRSLQS